MPVVFLTISTLVILVTFFRQSLVTYTTEPTKRWLHRSLVVHRVYSIEGWIIIHLFDSIHGCTMESVLWFRFVLFWRVPSSTRLKTSTGFNQIRNVEKLIQGSPISSIWIPWFSLMFLGHFPWLSLTSQHKLDKYRTEIRVKLGKILYLKHTVLQKYV